MYGREKRVLLREHLQEGLTKAALRRCARPDARRHAEEPPVNSSLFISPSRRCRLRARSCSGPLMPSTASPTFVCVFGHDAILLVFGHGTGRLPTPSSLGHFVQFSLGSLPEDQLQGLGIGPLRDVLLEAFASGVFWIEDAYESPYAVRQI